MKDTIFYKSDYHEEQTKLLLNKFDKPSIKSDLEYGVLAYIIGATFKAKNIESTIDNEGSIDLEQLYEIMAVFSSSEKNMIRFSLQCFNKSIDNITLSEVMHGLDDDNVKVIKQAIELLW
ncbi:hypothetical protein BTS2_3329 [Bacillus sp. TS-2]|nr:hypothetical protein BTS2_3329 [Bacillus sp. TS-2]